MRGRWRALGGLALAALLVSWLVTRTENLSSLFDILLSARQRPLWLAAGFALFGLSLGIGTLRWYLLLRALDLPISGSRAVRLYAVGHFFNGLAPGATGGDLVKAAAVVADCPLRRPEALASIVAERIIGLLTLCLLVSFVALFLPGVYEGPDALRKLRKFTLVPGALSICGFILLFGVDWLARIPVPEENGFLRKAAAACIRLYQAVRFCAVRPIVLRRTILLSMANHLCATACAISLGVSLGVDIGTGGYLLAVPLANLLAAIPITPGGAGMRESALVALLKLRGAETAQATALSLLLYGVLLAWAAIGGIGYITLRRSAKAGRPAATPDSPT